MPAQDTHQYSVRQIVDLVGGRTPEELFKNIYRTAGLIPAIEAKANAEAVKAYLQKWAEDNGATDTGFVRMMVVPVPSTHSRNPSFVDSYNMIWDSARGVNQVLGYPLDNSRTSTMTFVTYSGSYSKVNIFANSAKLEGQSEGAWPTFTSSQRGAWEVGNAARRCVISSAKSDFPALFSEIDRIAT